MNKLKKQTPDFVNAIFDKNGNKTSNQIGLKKNDEVGLIGHVKSLVSGKELKGKHYFDSSDGTIFISPTHTLSMTYNVNLSDVVKLETWKDTFEQK